MVIYFEDLQLSAIRDTERAFKAAKVKTSDRWMSRPLKPNGWSFFSFPRVRFVFFSRFHVSFRKKCSTELNLELTNKELEKIRAEADVLKMNSSKAWGTTHNTKRHVQWDLSSCKVMSIYTICLVTKYA